jgi:hypothetical protein
MTKMKNWIAALAFMASCTVANAGDYSFVGKWNCDVATFTFTNRTYDDGHVVPIRKIERFGNDYRIFFPEGYGIALWDVTAKTMTWHSLESGDTFKCTKAAVPRSETPLSGYWVIVASLSADSDTGQVEAVEAAAAPCHVGVYNDHANRFGFSDRSDLNVFVLSENRYEGDGLFATRAAAHKKADSVRRCFPDAYVKFGYEPGE